MRFANILDVRKTTYAHIYWRYLSSGAAAADQNHVVNKLGAFSETR